MAIAKKELDQRVAVLKRLKTQLLAQREKFKDYLVLLEKEGQSIKDGKVEVLEQQVQLEKSLVEEISAFQRVIEPLDKMAGRDLPEKEHEEIIALRENLDGLRSKVMEKNTYNRQALKEALDQIKNKIYKIKPVRGKNPYGAYGQANPSMIDIIT